MRTALARSWGLTKPPLGAQLHTGHPLMAGLMAAWGCQETGGRTLQDLTGRGCHLAFNNAGTTWDSAVSVRTGMRADANDEGASATTPAHLKLSFPISLVWKGYVLGQPAQFGYLLGVSYDNADAQPWSSYNISYDPSTWRADTNNVVTNSYNTYDVDYTVGPLMIGAVFTAASVYMYLNGRLVKTGAGPSVATPAYAATSQTAIGDYAGVSRHPNAIADYGLIYNRLLTDSDMWALYADPYAWFQPPPDHARRALAAAGGQAARAMDHYRRRRVA